MKTQNLNMTMKTNNLFAKLSVPTLGKPLASLFILLWLSISVFGQNTISFDDQGYTNAQDLDNFTLTNNSQEFRFKCFSSSPGFEYRATSNFCSYTGGAPVGTGSAQTAMTFATTDGVEIDLTSIDIINEFVCFSCCTLTITLTGYKDGSPVSGATYTASNTGLLTTFDVSGDNDFDAIDSLRITSFSNDLTGTLLDNVVWETSAPANPPVIASISSQTNVDCNGANTGSLTATATDGTANFDYAWSNGATTSNTASTTNTISSLAAGTYTVTITDANANTSTASATITQPSSALVASAAISSTLDCNGDTDAQVTATPSGGTSGYTYAWNTGGTFATETGLGAGTYYVTITDANSCWDSASVTVTEPTALVASAAVSSTLDCNGDTDGQVTATPSGGTSGYTYAWNTGGTFATETGLGAGTYYVTITDANSCWDSASVTVTEPTTLTAGIVIDSSVSCNGFSDGGLTADGTGGTAPYSFSWSNTATTATITGIPAATYKVTVTDANLCTSTSTKILTQPTALSVSVNLDQNASCIGSSDGKATATAAGGSSPYTYAWSNGATTSYAHGLAAGTYTVTATDAKGCIATNSVNISDGIAIVDKTVSAADDTVCIGGTATIQVISSETDIVYYLRDDANDAVIGTPKTGDGNDLDFTTATITSATSFNIFAKKPVNSPGLDFDGTNDYISVPAPANVPIGNANYTIEAWIYADSMGDHGIIGWGGYNVNNYVTALRLKSDGIRHLWWNNDLNVTTGDITGAWHHIAATFDGTTRSIYLDGQLIGSDTPAGHAVPHTNNFTIGRTNTVEYFDGKIDEVRVWNTARTQNEIISTMHDALAGNEAGLVAYYNLDENSGTTAHDATANINNGTMYNMNASDWVGGAKTSSCESEMTDVVTVTPVNVDATAMVDANISCNGNADGKLSANVVGGSKPYSYAWSTGAVTAAITGLDVGTYTVTVTDACTGTATSSASIAEPTVLTISTVVDSNVTCNGFSNGGATATPSGGTTPYLVTWEDHPVYSATNVVTPTGGNSSGHAGSNWPNKAYDASAATFWRSTSQYNTYISNDLGNTTRKAIVKYTIQNGDHEGLKDWIFEASNDHSNWVGFDTVSNQTWTPGEIKNFTFENTTEYRYYRLNVLAFNNNASSFFDVAELEMYQEATQPSVGDLPAGTYTVTVKDANGCTATNTATITEPTALSATADIDSTVSCNGFSDGGMTASSTGGTSGYTYNWSNSATNKSITGVAAGTYTVTVTDANACTATASNTVTEPTALSTVAMVDSNVSCNGFSDGGMTTIPSGGTGPYAYTWNNAATNASITGVVAGTYTVTVTDANACTATSSSTVTEPTVLTTTAVVDSNVSCNGFSDGGMTASPTGGTAPYNYIWNNAATNASITGVTAGTYTVTVTDANACTATSSNPVTEPATLVATAVVDSNASCNGFSDGGVSVSATGGTGSYTYNWSNGATTQVITGVVAGTYTATVSDANACTASAYETVKEPTVLAVSIDSVSNVTANGNSDGFIGIIVAGGTTGYSYAWSNGSTTKDISGISGGNYSVTVTDANGCVVTTSQFVSEPPVLINPVTSTSYTSPLAISYSLPTTPVAGSVTIQFVGSTTVTLTMNDNMSNSFSWDLTTDPTLLTEVDAASAMSLPEGTYNVELQYFPAGGSATVSDVSSNVEIDMHTETPDLIEPVANTINSTPIAIEYSLPEAPESGSVQLIIDQGISTIATLTMDNVQTNAFNWNPTTDPSALSEVVSFSGSVLTNGIYKFTLSYRDALGNAIASDVHDSVAVCPAPPAVTAKDVTVQLNASGQASITASSIHNTSYSHCGIDSIWASKTAFNCNDFGSNTVILTAMDGNGLTATSTATVTVEDPILPTVSTKDITVQLNASGTVTILGSDIDDNSFDNCTIATRLVTPGTFSCSEVGVNTVTLTVTDVNSNSSTQTATVTVVDDILPTVVTKDITVQLTALGMVGIAPAQVDDGSYDNCIIADRSVTPNSFNCAEVGINTVTLTIIDTNGNANSATASVLVEDNVPPTAIARNITVQLDGSGQAAVSAVNVDNGSSDICGIASVYVDPVNFTCSEVGSNSVTLTVVDVNGNSATTSANVMVEDNVVPVVNTKDVTLQLDINGQASITVSDVDNGSADNCDIVSKNVTPFSFTCTDVGANIVTLVITDANGNENTATASVTIEDDQAPNILTKDITVQLDANGMATITGADVDNNSTDNCTIASFVAEPDTFECGEVGSNPVTLTITDVNGNSDAGEARVTVEDNILPTVITRDITVQLDTSGTVQITAEDVNNGSYDNCAVISKSVVPDNFTCNEAGNNTVTLSVTDIHGNVNTKTATVTVKDEVMPTVLCTSVEVSLTVDGTASITVPQIDNGSFDNCQMDSLSLSKRTFICTDLGTNSVTLTGVDVYGNSSSCIAAIVVKDEIVPEITCQPADIYLGSGGFATVTPGDINGGSWDNCGIVQMTVSPEQFNCNSTGKQFVTLSVSDAAGNSTSCTAEVNILDVTAPTITVKDAVIHLDSFGVAHVGVSQVYLDGQDNCGIAGVDLERTDFTCSDIGNNTIIALATDLHGNIYSTSLNVEVIDDIAPVVKTQNIDVYLNEGGTLTLEPTQIDGGSYDNCGITGMTLDKTDFDCQVMGLNQVTLTVVDNSGNTASGTATINVMDTLAPSADCQADVVICALDGNGVQVNYLLPKAIDNCSAASITQVSGFSSGSVFPVGKNTIAFVTQDDYMNQGYCSFDIIVHQVNEIDLGDDTTMCYGTDFVLSISTDYSDIHWSTGDNGNEIIPAQPGQYWVTAKDQNGCASTDSVGVVFENCTVGIGGVEQTASGITVFPNPTSGMLYIQHSGDDMLEKIEVLNSVGEVVKSEVVNTSKVILELSDLSKAIYFIKITGQDHQHYYKKVLLTK